MPQYLYLRIWAVDANEFVGRCERLKLGNGGSWRRGDGLLAREFSIQRIKEQGRIAAVELCGEQPPPIGKPIPARIKAQIAAPRCVALYTSNPECGRKGGRRDAPRLSAASSPASEDFQPPPKAATNANHQPTRTSKNPAQRSTHSPAKPPPPQGNPPHRAPRPGRRRRDARRFRAEVGG